jgi:hypothetical protein
MTIFANENPGGAWIGYLECLSPPGSDCLFAPGSHPGYLDCSNWTVNVNRFLKIFSIFVVTYCSARTSFGE